MPCCPDSPRLLGWTWFKEEEPVSERQHERLDEPDSVEPRAEWIRPEVDRLIAGGAQSGGATDTDGIDIQS